MLSAERPDPAGVSGKSLQSSVGRDVMRRDMEVRDVVRRDPPPAMSDENRF